MLASPRHQTHFRPPSFLESYIVRDTTWKAYHNAPDPYIEDIKEKLCYVAVDAKAELKRAKPSRRGGSDEVGIGPGAAYFTIHVVLRRIDSRAHEGV